MADSDLDLLEHGFSQLSILDETEGYSSIKWTEERGSDFNPDTAKDYPADLPYIILSNANSLPNKMEELRYLLKTDSEYKRCDLLCFTETWLTSESGVSMEGFDQVQEERKGRTGGGLITYYKVGNDVRKFDDFCIQNEDYEIMVFSYKVETDKRVPPIIFIQLYIPGKYGAAKKPITSCYTKLLTWSNGGPIFILGDFNKCELLKGVKGDIEGIEQYVTCHTRGGNILDKCYGNIPKAYISTCKLPLGMSDHRVIVLHPTEKHRRAAGVIKR